MAGPALRARASPPERKVFAGNSWLLVRDRAWYLASGISLQQPGNHASGINPVNPLQLILPHSPHLFRSFQLILSSLDLYSRVLLKCSDLARSLPKAQPSSFLHLPTYKHHSLLY